MNEISRFLQTRIEAGDFPSAVYLVAEKDEIVLTDALGRAVVEPEPIAADLATIYDLASLTKPLVTGLLCARLIEKKELDLGQSAGHYLPEFNRLSFSPTDSVPDAARSTPGPNGFGRADVCISDLLTHTSGNPAWKPFYLLVENRPAILGEIARTEPAERPGVIYSDLNFLILTFLIEKMCGAGLDEVAAQEIFRPLGLRDTFYHPPPQLRPRIAASEWGNEYEKKMCLEMGYEIGDRQAVFRDRLIWGEVHDNNCFFMNGVSGHAGLFSTAAETLRIARQFLAGQTELLDPATCRLFQTNLTPGLDEARSIAFQLAATKDSTAGEALSKNSFGHLGFTGTSLWIEPGSERIFILLTNRTHARPLPFAHINSVRRRFHQLAAAYLNNRR